MRERGWMGEWEWKRGGERERMCAVRVWGGESVG